MKKFYITTSIAYTNNFPHLGFALELIQADVLARYHRILGDDVFFLTGTDEHGIKIAEKAKELGKNPNDFVDQISKAFRKLAKVLNISNDDFIRTTDKKKHWPAVKKIWEKIEKKGDIYKKKYKSLYCSGCEAFITEKELVGGKCPIHQKKPEMVEEENYFFRLSKYSERIEKKIKEEEIKIIPPARKNEVMGFINQGLADISFSRLRSRLKWGIGVPGDSSQTIYVWADALSNYISALGYPSGKKFKKYWPADVHCLGKDILKFHALIWLAMLLSLELKLPKKILVHGFVSVNNQKMSKSLGNVVDPFKLVERYSSASSPLAGADSVRYFLLREIPSTEDGDFTYKKFEERYNSDLANGLGNLVARIRVMAEKSKTKNKEIKTKIKDKKIREKINKAWKNYHHALGNFQFNKALEKIWELISFSDKYIEKERPWENGTLISPKAGKNQKIINNLLVILDNIAEMIEPFLPETSKRVKKEIERDKKSGKFINKRGKALFPRI